MRALAAILLSVFFLLPSLAAASSLPSCFMSQKASISPQEKIFAKPSAKSTAQINAYIASVKSYLNNAIYCPNPCYDVKIRIIPSNDGTLRIQPSNANKCSASDASSYKKDNRGCSKGETPPKVAIVVDKIDYPLGFTTIHVLPSLDAQDKSRCDSGLSDLLNKTMSDFNTMVRTKSLSAADPIKQDYAMFQRLPNATAPAGTDLTYLSSALYKSGVPLDEANALAKSNPDQVSQLIQKAQAGDTADAQKIATSLGLNPDIAGKIGTISSASASGDGGNGGSTTGNGYESGPTGFGSGNTYRGADGLPTQCGIRGIAGNFMLAESGCGRNVYSSTTNVHGPLQYLCSTWLSYTAATGYGQYANCAYANNPQISAVVTNARYELFKQQYGASCASAGLSWGSCAYAIHVFGTGGYQSLLAAYERNPNAPAASVCGVTAISSKACSNNRSIFANGGTVGGVFGELQRRISGSSIVDSYVNRSAYPFGVNAAYNYAQTSGYLYRNPFYAQNAAYSLAYGQSAAQQYVYPQNTTTGGIQSSVSGSTVTTVGGNGTNAVQTSSSNNSTSVTVTQNYSVSGGAGNAASSGSAHNAANSVSVTSSDQPPTKPAATIIAQPGSVSAGESVRVSWSSVGMSTAKPCRVTLNHQYSFATGNNGAQSATTTGHKPGDSLTFTLSCTGNSGEAVSRSATVQIQ